MSDPSIPVASDEHTIALLEALSQEVGSDILSSLEAGLRLLPAPSAKKALLLSACAATIGFYKRFVEVEQKLLPEQALEITVEDILNVVEKAQQVYATAQLKSKGKGN